MRSNLFRFVMVMLVFCLALGVVPGQLHQAQAQRPTFERRQPTDAQRKKEKDAEAAEQKQKPAGKTPNAPPAEQAGDTLTIDTDLVTVPVIASDRSDVYVSDLKKEEFTVFEDGVKQELVFFAPIKEPFQVVLMLDTSGSTQEKLGQIQRAARKFIELLQPGDRIKVIAFDDQVYDLCGFTSHRGELQEAINATRAGQGTKLYDAVKFALNSLSRVKGRKAIVLFTDGVDWTSDSTRYEDNLAMIEEAGVIIYPIQYNTRADLEEKLRQQQEAGNQVDLGSVLGGSGRRSPGGNTPPTIPGGGSPIPSGRGGQNDPYGIPIPPVVIGPRYPGGNRYPDNRNPGGNRYPDDRYPGGNRYPDDRYPSGGRYPDDRYPSGGRYPDDRSPGGNRYPDDRYPSGGRYPDSRDSRSPGRRSDNISVMLDGLYSTATEYLREMAGRSGGEVYRADSLQSLPEVFAIIAAELRNQYSLGYYSSNAARDGKFRRIKVAVSRREVVVRSRPGYRAPNANTQPNPSRKFISNDRR